MPSASTRASNVPHVVCLGGGYVAIYLAKALRRHVKAGRVRLTVVDLENFQCFHGLIPEMLTGKIQPTDTLSPARRLFAPGDFVNAEVEEIDLKGKQVTVARLLDGRRLTLDYDHLVLALGATEHLGRFPGLAEHSHRLKAYSGCLGVRNQIINMLELADMERDAEERRRLLSFVIVGGNYAGVEVAGELREFLPEVVERHFPNIPVDEIRITLVVSGDHILPELHAHKPKLVDYAQREMAKDPRLKILYKERLASATVEEAILQSGERIPTRTIISCTGNAVVPVLESLAVKKNDRGRVMTDRHAQVEGQENVWAGGDCAAVPLSDGTTAPALAIWAMTVGRLIGKNIMRKTEGKPLLNYEFTGLGDACVVGNHRAVAQLKGIPVRGPLAWLIWRAFMLTYLPSPEKKIRVLWNWLMAPFFGRDLVNMRVHQPLDLAPMVFEEGQDIVRKGEVGNSMYLIQEGEVVVLDDPNGAPLAVLGRGDHFGEIAVFDRVPRTATVRARGRVKVLQVRRDAVTALSDTIEGVGSSLRARPGGAA